MIKVFGMLGLAAVISAPATTSFAQATGVSDETGFMFNTFMLLFAGVLVFWMSAGFTMLEAGLVRSKNVAMQLAKNVGLLATASLSFLLIGSSLENAPDGWLIEGLVSASFPSVASLPPVDSVDLGQGAESAAAASTYLFQLLFCIATASIVSGALAERVRLWPFLIFTAVLTGFIYPIQASWTWSGGFLAEVGFVDVAGATAVHSVGGWAALAGALILGPRVGKYTGGRVNPMPGSSLPLATIGMFILWMGWFGFNAGSLLVINDAGSVANVARIFANTHSGAVGGGIAALIATQLLFKKIDLTMVINGVLAGLVSVTADPLSPSLVGATLIGGVGGALVVLVVPLFDRIRVDDVVGAISVHLCAGLWGTIAVAFSNADASIVSQFMGIAVTGAFVFPVSIGIWIGLRSVIGIRTNPANEAEGLDITELGMEAYPDFIQYEDEPA